MQPIDACTQFKEILRIIFGPIRMDFTEAGLTQQEEDYPEGGFPVMAETTRKLAASTP